MGDHGICSSSNIDNDADDVDCAEVAVVVVVLVVDGSTRTMTGDAWGYMRGMSNWILRTVPVATWIIIPNAWHRSNITSLVNAKRRWDNDEDDHHPNCCKSRSKRNSPGLVEIRTRFKDDCNCKSSSSTMVLLSPAIPVVAVVFLPVVAALMPWPTVQGRCRRFIMVPWVVARLSEWGVSALQLYYIVLMCVAHPRISAP